MKSTGNFGLPSGNLRLPKRELWAAETGTLACLSGNLELPKRELWAAKLPAISLLITRKISILFSTCQTGLFDYSMTLSNNNNRKIMLGFATFHNAFVVVAFASARIRR